MTRAALCQHTKHLQYPARQTPTRCQARLSIPRRRGGSPVTTIPDNADRVANAAWRQLAEHINDLSAHGPDYMRRYVNTCLNGGVVQARALHPELARLVRDVVQDELVWERRKRAHVA